MEYNVHDVLRKVAFYFVRENKKINQIFKKSKFRL